MKLPSKPWLITIGILLLFILTNPSVSAFKAYIGSNTYLGLKKTTNFFVCSLYKHSGSEYFGILGNFFDIKKQHIEITVNENQKDSSQMEADTIAKNNDPLGILKKK